MENAEAARAGDIVVLTVPADHQISTLELVKDSLAGKILIDVTVPWCHLRSEQSKCLRRAAQENEHKTFWRGSSCY